MNVLKDFLSYPWRDFEDEWNFEVHFIDKDYKSSPKLTWSQNSDNLLCNSKCASIVYESV
jgi:hypothetical protein